MKAEGVSVETCFTFFFYKRFVCFPPGKYQTDFVRTGKKKCLGTSLLFKVLDITNFRPSFLNWIHTFYSNISTCVVNNGYSSEFFSLQRGVRQGCPLSGLLFVLSVEPLAHQIRINESIKGLENGNKITKLSLYVDDTTAFIRDDSSAASLFTLLDQFGDLSGLKINKSKTEGLWLGSWKSRLGKDEPSWYFVAETIRYCSWNCLPL